MERCEENNYDGGGEARVPPPAASESPGVSDGLAADPPCERELGVANEDSATSVDP